MRRMVSIGLLNRLDDVNKNGLKKRIVVTPLLFYLA